MNLNEIIKSGTNVSITVEAKDLKHFADYLIDKTKKEIEDVVISDKAESYPTVRQVTEMLNVDASTLWRWNKKGYLKTIEFGGGRRYKMSEVKALMNGGRS
jgi:hypothetical protein